MMHRCCGLNVSAGYESWWPYLKCCASSRGNSWNREKTPRSLCKFTCATIRFSWSIRSIEWIYTSKCETVDPIFTDQKSSFKSDISNILLEMNIFLTWFNSSFNSIKIRKTLNRYNSKNNKVRLMNKESLEARKLAL